MLTKFLKFGNQFPEFKANIGIQLSGRKAFFRACRFTSVCLLRHPLPKQLLSAFDGIAFLIQK